MALAVRFSFILSSASHDAGALLALGDGGVQPPGRIVHQQAEHREQRAHSQQHQRAERRHYDADYEVRSVDVAEEMGYSKPSVSRAMGLLKNGGYIKVDENGFITLLEPGREVAEMIYERHTLLTQYLIRLGVSPEVAAEDACKLEHVISDESFQAIKRHAHLGTVK